VGNILVEEAIFSVLKLGKGCAYKVINDQEEIYTGNVDISWKKRQSANKEYF
jgi:hypothetical protein